ncbi:MAG: hypothetical protein RIS92_2238 [Verrucomicrobiota bacterium]
MSSERRVGEESDEVFSVAIFRERLGELLYLFGGNPAFAEGDFFGAGDFESLTIFESGDELSGFEKGFVGSGVEPSVAAAHEFDLKLGLFEVEPVEVGDFQFAACGGF